MSTMNIFCTIIAAYIAFTFGGGGQQPKSGLGVLLRVYTTHN